MNQTETGAFIRHLRTQKGLTQKSLASAIGVTEQAVSKWERGLGLPDHSIMKNLAEVLGTEPGILLSGKPNLNKPSSGNMKMIKFHICPDCGNIITSLQSSDIYCCGKKLEALTAEKAAEKDQLKTEIIENEYFISSDHEMSKKHYISFIALVSGDTVIIRKLYPQWNLQTRLPRIPYSTLIWYCTKHGLMYQYIRTK